MSTNGKGGSRRRRAAIAVAVAAAVGLIPALASAHIERAAYWPDPAPDNSVSPPAGGAVPTYRGLFTALDAAPPGDTRVVCQGAVPKWPTRQLRRARRTLRGAARRRRVAKLKARYRRQFNTNSSIERLRASINSTVAAGGFKYRPMGQTVSFSQAQGDALLAFNKRLLAQCRFHSIQDAVTASHNNDRVVIMPGIYTEPKSRAAPTNDPKCDGLEEQNDRGQTGALSYRYQLTCPNDQNLIAVMGRAANGSPPQPPLDDRHGVPDEGACIRCNFQMEGSGVSADDVVVDGGRVASGNHGPADPVKDVGIRADRADGFVLANLTVRHVAEHGIYVLESDGYLLDRFKAFYNEEYGVLTFVEDHGLMQRCEAAGSGDSGLYPGAGAETGQETEEATQRYNQEIRDCESHHNASGYSGTASNAIHVDHNDFYDNALGFTTDVFTAAGHPGFPQDSDLVEDNNFFSNNFNPYVEGSDVVPTVPVPVGTGMWIAGGNNNTMRNNHFWDNWRRGTMLFAVPDSFVCGPSTGNSQHGCDPNSTSTSYDNEYYGNVMGRTPGGTPDPNGTDFWWDQFLGNTGNCWHDNIGTDGTAGTVTSDPPSPFLPSDCGSSNGTGGPEQESELVNCLGDIEFDTSTCDWFTTPPEPQPQP